MTSIRAKNATRIAGGFFDDTVRGGRSDSQRRHRPVGSATERDGLEGLAYARTIGNASRLAPAPRGRGGDKIQGQASIVVVWYASRYKRHLHVFKQLFPLGLRKTNYQPDKAR